MEVPQIEGLGPAIDVRPLLGPERSALVELLAHLSEDDWQRETACDGWSVHDLILHLIHDDLRRLSVHRDRHPGEDLGAVPSLDVLVTRLDEANERWVRAVRRADGTTESDAFLETTPELLWKRAVRMVSRADVAEGSRFAGDEAIVRALLDLRAAIVSDQEP